MKTKKTFAVLAASAMMLTLVGCGTSAEALSTSEGLSIEEITASTEASSDTASDVGSTESSADAAAESSSTAITVDLSEADASFEYNGKTISVFDDDKTLKGALGEEIPDYTYTNDMNITYSSYGTKEDSVSYSVWNNNGEMLPLDLGICDKNIKTSKGIGVGNTKDEVIAAYGDSYTVATYSDNTLEYDCGSFKISLDFDKEDKLLDIRFINTENTAKAIKK